jgi:hypothetical protein
MDNRLGNLKILCPNCHAQENGLIKKNIKHRKNIVKNIKYCECGAIIKKRSTICEKCWGIKQRKVIRPAKIDLLIDVRDLGYVGTGRKYGVSDNAIRKWLK